MHRRV